MHTLQSFYFDPASMWVINPLKATNACPQSLIISPAVFFQNDWLHPLFYYHAMLQLTWLIYLPSNVSTLYKVD